MTGPCEWSIRQERPPNSTDTSVGASAKVRLIAPQRIIHSSSATKPKRKPVQAKVLCCAVLGEPLWSRRTSHLHGTCQFLKAAMAIISALQHAAAQHHNNREQRTSPPRSAPWAPMSIDSFCVPP